MLFDLALALLSLLALSTPISARFRPLRQRQPESADPPACKSNSECLQLGLPIRPPGRRPLRRQSDEPLLMATCTFNGAQTFLLPAGRYFISMAAAAGASSSINAGGSGVGLAVNLTAAVDTVLGYFVGCPGATVGGVGGGGGGTFLYINGANSPALIVVGGGGGAGLAAGAAGQPAPIGITGVATRADGTPGSTMGMGGQAYPGTTTGGTTGGGAGGGFVTAGTSSTSAQGGSQSTNYGGDFSGGLSLFGFSANTGGLGGGGGAGTVGGGGGGGWSGGGAGAGADSTFQGGGGGGSYVNPAPPAGFTIRPLGIGPAFVGTLVIRAA